MIRWRRDTVITFHSTIATPERTPASHTTTAEEVSPITVNVTASTPIAANRLVPGVSRVAIRSATSEPSTAPTAVPVITAPNRSEEHTSELQSRGHLVCRLLLEKKT